MELTLGSTLDTDRCGALNVPRLEFLRKMSVFADRGRQFFGKLTRWFGFETSQP